MKFYTTGQNFHYREKDEVVIKWFSYNKKIRVGETKPPQYIYSKAQVKTHVKAHFHEETFCSTQFHTSFSNNTCWQLNEFVNTLIDCQVQEMLLYVLKTFILIEKFLVRLIKKTDFRDSLNSTERNGKMMPNIYKTVLE